ncbi:nucleotidyltransferase domain-containing protein [Verrucomicrobiota bacterium]
MVKKKQINRFVKEVTQEFSPEKVVLFGSYANGQPSEDSDVDLLVIMRHKKRNVMQALEIDKRIDRSFPLDLIVKTPKEVKTRLSQNDIFIRSIVDEGKVLYEKNH